MNRRKFLRGSVGVAGTVAMAGAGWWGLARWEQSRAEVDVVDWMRGQLHPFDADRPDSIAADGAIITALAGARVIGIGEATHGSHNDVACKAALVRSLVRAGAIDTLLLEANGPGGRELDAFIAGEEGDAMERVRTAAIFRILKTQDMAELLVWLRDWNRTAPRPVRIVGVDCQATPADAAFALDWLGTVDAAVAAEFRQRLAFIVSAEARARRFPDFVATLTTAQVRGAMTDLEVLRTTLADTGPYAQAEGRRVAERAARAAWQGLYAFEHDVSDAEPAGDWGAYFSRRDQAMAENCQRAADGQGAVYWAHNTHVAGAPLGNGGERIEPTGYFLRQALGSAYKAVLFEYATARFLAVPALPVGSRPPATDPQVLIEWGYAAGRLADVFRALGSGDAWVDLSALPDVPRLTEWAAREYAMRAPGYMAARWVHLTPAFTVQPRPTIDVLIHVEALSPARMLG